MGPYFMKSWVPIRSLFLRLEVPISLGNSASAGRGRGEFGNGEKEGEETREEPFLAGR